MTKNHEVKDVVEDPSPAVQLFMGNAAKYLEQLHELGLRHNAEKLQFFIDQSRRERETESNRINALREVDLEAVKVANERATKQAELLATQMLENAEVLRKAVETTATTIAAQLAQITNQQNEKIALLEKNYWENMGKSSAPTETDKQLDELKLLLNTNKGKERVNDNIQKAMYAVVASLITTIILTVIQYFINK